MADRACLAGWLGGLAPIADFNPLLQMASGVYLTFFGSFVFGTPGFPLSDVPLQKIAADVAAGRLDGKPSASSASRRSAKPIASWRPTRPVERWSFSATDVPLASRRHPMAKSVAIITGASQGIGRSTAIRLARDFSALVLVARDRANLDETAEAVKTAGAEALVIDIDLAQPAAAQAVVHQTLAAFGRIDALLNIAGAVPQIDLFEMTDAQWEGGLALKLHGARRLTIAAWAALKAVKGSVVLMSGNSGAVSEGALCGGRHDQCGDRRLGQGVRHRGIADGVQVNSVLPGPVMTGRRRSYLQHWAPLHNMTVEEATANFPKEAGIARYGGPEEIAELMAFLVSPGGPLDDRLDAPHGRRRGEVDLTKIGPDVSRPIRRSKQPRKEIGALPVLLSH